MNLFLIANPSAGRARAPRNRVPRTLERVKAELGRLGIDYSIAVTRAPRHAEELARAAVSDGFDHILALGGDGLIGEIANGIAGSDAVLATIPCGTGNDFARNLGLPSDPVEGVRLLREGKVRVIDTAEVNGRRFLNIASIGFDSVTNDLANRTAWLSGKKVYVYAVLRSLIGFQAACFKVRAPGISLETRAMMVSVANGGTYGGGMRLVPDAAIDDGLLDVCIVEETPLWYFLYMFPKVFAGTHTTSPAVKIFRATEITVECDRKFSVFADGEYATELPASYRILPATLRVLVPASTTG